MGRQKESKPKGMPLKSIKINITKEFTKARTLIALVERLMNSEIDAGLMTVIAGYVEKLAEKLVLLEGIPTNAEDLIRGDELLSSPKVFSENMKEIEEHLDARGYRPLKDQLVALMGRVNLVISEFYSKSGLLTKCDMKPDVQADGTPQQRKSKPLVQPIVEKEIRACTSQHGSSVGSQVAQQGSANTTAPSTELGSNPLNGGTSMSSYNNTEFADTLCRRIQNIEYQQELLWETCGVRCMESHPKPQTEQHPNSGFHGTIAQSNGSNLMIKPEGYKWQCTSFDPKTGRPVFTQVKIVQESKEPETVEQHMYSPDGNQSATPGTQAVMVKSLSPKLTENSSPLVTTNLIMSIINAIPTFDGKRENYHLFRQSFNMLVHDRSDISIEMKQTLLLRLLNEETRDMMRSSDISAEGYESLWNNLDRQFAREKDTKLQLIEQIQRFSFEEEDFDQMEKDLNRYCVIVNMLKVNGCNVDDAFFLENFVTKLPEKIMTQVYKKNRERSRTFQELVGIAYDTLSEKKALERAREKKKRTVYATEVFTIEAGESISPEKETGEEIDGDYQDGTCHYCDSPEHLALDCPLSLHDKLKAVDAKELCYNCLLPNHIRKWCQSKNNCQICGGRHYTAHCRKRNDGSSQFFRATEDRTSGNH